MMLYNMGFPQENESSIQVPYKYQPINILSDASDKFTFTSCFQHMQHEIDCIYDIKYNLV